MEKNYRIYSDSEHQGKKLSNDRTEKETRTVSDSNSSSQSLYMSGNKDGMTSNKAYSMY